eukprot:tig00021254_g19683.t1
MPSPRANGFKWVGTQQKGDATKANCALVGVDSEIDSNVTAPWDPYHVMVGGVNVLRVGVGGVEVARGDYNKACYKGPDCTEGQVLATNGVGGDFWKACQAKGYMSVAVQQTWGGGDKAKASCFNVGSSGEVDANKTVSWAPLDQLEFSSVQQA